MKTFKVGTFYDGRRFSAYTLWYTPHWSGCIEYDVEAVNGTEAKKKAIQQRKIHEAKQQAAENPTQDARAEAHRDRSTDGD